MIPIKLSLEGFTSYNEPAEINFTGFDLACISGPNGAGKSSLLDAMTYALYGKARKTDDAIINTGSKKAEVTLDFEYEGQVYRVTRSLSRGKSTLLDFFIHNPAADNPLNEWKVLSERTVRETDAKIVNTLRLDYDTFVSASFFLQGKADSFATQKPADRKRLLSSILGLDQWEKYCRMANTQARARAADAAIVAERLRESQEELDQESAHQAALADLEAKLKLAVAELTAQQSQLEMQRAMQRKLEEQHRTVELLKKQLDKAQNNHDGLMANLTEKQGKWDGYNDVLNRADQTEAAYTALQALRAQLAAADKQADQFRPIDNERQQLLNDLKLHAARLDKDIKHLDEEKHTLENRKSQGETLREELDRADAKVRDLQKELAREEVIERDLEDLRKHNSDMQQQNGSLKSQMSEIKERQINLQNVEGASCPLCGQPLTADHRAQLLDELELEGTRLGDLYRANREAQEINQSTNAALVRERGQLQQKHKDLQALIRDKARLDSQLEQLHVEALRWQELKEPELSRLRTELEGEAYLPDTRARIGEIERTLSELGYDAQAHMALRQQEHAARTAEEEYRKLESARSAVDQIREAVEELQDRLKAQEKDLSENNRHYSEAVGRLAADEAGLPDIHATENKLASLKEDESELQRRIGGVKQELENVERQRERQVCLRADQEQINSEIRSLKALEKAFGKDGVPAMLIEQALPELEVQTNDILLRLSDYTMSVTFKPQRAYKDPRREDKRETLDITISDGSATRDYETYSGGEAFRINFSIRLALSRVLARRAGAKLQTLVIDEGFGNQDALGRQRLIEAINLVQKDFEKVLIITHIEELKDQFPNRIEVEKTASGSKVKVLINE